jgi:hypothetical protein
MKKVISLALIALVLLPVGFAFAQVGNGTVGLPSPTETNIGTDTGGIIRFVCTVFNYVFFALLLAAVGFVLLAAYRYLTAAGDPEAVSKANKTLIFAAVAVAVALLARAVPVIVGNFVLNSNQGSSFDVCNI